jgi:hypothetical protein
LGRSKTARAKAKSDAWAAFSRYIRTRDCIRFRNSTEEGMCVTCKFVYPFGRLQAGHFITGRGNSVLFDERLVYSQCGGCNLNPPRGKGGNHVEYFRFMLDEVGLEKIDEFRALKKDTKIYKIPDFLELEQQFKEKTEALLEAHH